MSEQTNNTKQVTFTFHPGEVSTEIALETTPNTVVKISCILKESFLHREHNQLSDLQIAASILQIICDKENFFISGNPHINMKKRLESKGDLSFNANIPVLLPPKLQYDDFVNEIQNWLDDEDFESKEAWTQRVFDLVESKINYPLPEEYIQNTNDKLKAISDWRRSIALAAIGSIPTEENITSNTLKERAFRILDKIFLQFTAQN
jgi:hypothetical protein